MAKFNQSPVYSGRFIQALQLAAEWHQCQVRKQGTPYVAHLLSVSALVMEAGGSEDEAIAALLHDAVEDVNIPLEKIRELFGDRVAKIVEEVTEDKSVREVNRKEAYVLGIKWGSLSAVRVSAADKLHNLRSYAQTPEYFTEAVERFYEKLIPVYKNRIGSNHVFVIELEEIFSRLKQ